jgi:REP element-mobilizing transposase RayT
MKQQSLQPKKPRKTEHGGSLLVGRRRKARPLSTKEPIHLVLRSDFASGRRALTGHRPLIEKVLRKAQLRFRIKVYEKAIVSNHIHLLVKGDSKQELQNFFRVVAGHIAQEILRNFPIQKHEKPKPGGAPSAPSQTAYKTREKENKFWETRIYSRLVTWGRDFFGTKKYVVRNTLEALGIIAYQPRNKSHSRTCQGQRPQANRRATDSS